jgi:hypothetical protein
MKKSLTSCCVLTALVCGLQAQTAGPFNFDTSAELSDNFRATAGSGFASVVSVGAQSFVEVSATASNPWIGVFDTTPLNAADAAQTFSGPITLTLDVSAAPASASFGIFLFDAGNSSNNLLTIFNLDSTAGATGNEQIRFWRDTAINSGAVANQYTVASGLFTGTNGATDATTNSWVTSAAVRGDATVDTTSPFNFYTLTFTYDPVAATLRLASPSFSATLNIPGADLISNPAIALRVNDPTLNDANSVRIDNFAVVPEPVAASLFGFAGVALALRRPRRRA